MRKIFHWMMAAILTICGASVLTSCSNDDNPAGQEGEYTLSAKGQMAYTWLDQDGQQLQAGLTEKTPEMEAVFYADGIGQYLGAITVNCQVARAFGKDYSVTDTTIT